MRGYSGWRPDPSGVAEGTFAPRRTRGALPYEFTELAVSVGGKGPAALPVFNQYPSNRCVVYSAAEVLYGAMCDAGEENPGVLDVQGTYVMAQYREQHRRGVEEREPIKDQGLYPVDLVDATSKWGIHTVSLGEAVERFSYEHLFDDVTEEYVRTAAQWKLGGWRRVPDTEDERIVEEMKLLLYGYRMRGMFGMDLDRTFPSFSFGVYERDPRGTSAGQHMLSVHGYSDRLSAFLVLDHYGVEEHDRGWLWVGYNTVISTYVSDRYHLTARRGT